MRLNEFFNDEQVYNKIKLPAKRGEFAFLPFIKEKLTDIEKIIEQTDVNYTDATKIDPAYNNEDLLFFYKHLSDTIIKSLEVYLKGNSHHAYDIFKSGLDEIKHFFIRYSGQSHTFNLKNNYFYRIAEIKLKENESLKQSGHFEKRLLHPPFNMPEIIGSYRFSISGYPCLYLGSHPFVCEKELKKNLRTNQNLFISAFKLKESANFKLFDLRVKNHEIKDLSKKFDKTDFINCFSYLAFYPLLLSCYIECKHPKKPFKPEYIIPQFFLQWIKDQSLINFKGIIYSSTKFDLKDIEEENHLYNLVIPTYKKSDDDIYCPFITDNLNYSTPHSTNTFLKETNNSKPFCIEDIDESCEVVIDDFGLDKLKFIKTHNKIMLGIESILRKQIVTQ